MSPSYIYTPPPLPSRSQADDKSLLLASLGSITASTSPASTTSTSPSYRFTAGCLTHHSLLRVEVTVPLTGDRAAAGSHEIRGLARPAEAPVMCVAVGQEGCLMFGDLMGRVTVVDAEMNKHAQYKW